MSRKNTSASRGRSAPPARPSRTPSGKPRTKAARSSMSRQLNASEQKKAPRGPKQAVSTVPGKGAGKQAARNTTPMRDLGLALFAFAQKVTTSYADAIPVDRATAQAAPAVNHALWTFGHLALTNDWLATLVDGKPSELPANYNALFGMESVPVSDPGHYPPFAEVRAAYTRAGARLVAAVKRLDDVALAGPLEGEGHGFVTYKADALVKAAWHEGWHTGQITDLRRGLGITKKA